MYKENVGRGEDEKFNHFFPFLIFFYKISDGFRLLGRNRVFFLKKNICIFR